MTTTIEPPVQPPPGAGQGDDVPTPAAPVRAPRVLFGELTSSLSAVLLLVFLFATQWYGVAGVPDPSAARPAISSAETGWDALSVVRWMVLGTALVASGSVLLHASQRRHGAKTDTSRVIAGLGTLTSVLLAYRVLIALPSSGMVIDQKLGAVLGLVCALGIALGGYESIAEHHARTRAVGPRSSRRARRHSGASEPVG